MYQEFLDFKEEIMNKLGAALRLESKSKDVFEYRNPNDVYFGGAANEPSWNTPSYSPQL